MPTKPVTIDGQMSIDGAAAVPVHIDGTATWDEAPPEPEPPSKHPYFDMLAARTDCLSAHSFRTQENIDSIKTTAQGALQPGILPVTYDEVQDAAKWAIDCLGQTTDGKMAWTAPAKWFPLGPLLGQGSVLFTWEFMFDTNWRWVKEGDIGRHKMWWIQHGDGGGWNLYDTEWRQTALKHPSAVGEAYLHCAKAKDYWMVPGESWQLGETIMPRLAQFFFKENQWCRLWHFLEGNLSGGRGGEPLYISSWAADHEQGVIQLYDRTAMYGDVEGLKWFKIGYDTSSSYPTNPYMESWQRNIVILKNIPLADVPPLLQAP